MKKWIYLVSAFCLLFLLSLQTIIISPSKVHATAGLPPSCSFSLPADWLTKAKAVLVANSVTYDWTDSTSQAIMARSLGGSQPRIWLFSQQVKFGITSNSTPDHWWTSYDRITTGGYRYLLTWDGTSDWTFSQGGPYNDPAPTGDNDIDCYQSVANATGGLATRSGQTDVSGSANTTWPDSTDTDGWGTIVPGYSPPPECPSGYTGTYPDCVAPTPEYDGIHEITPRDEKLISIAIVFFITYLVARAFVFR